MGYAASKGVRDHRIAAKQSGRANKSWDQYTRDVDTIVERVHQTAPVTHTHANIHTHNARTHTP